MPERLPRWAMATMVVFAIAAVALFVRWTTAPPSWEMITIGGVAAHSDSPVLEVRVHHSLCDHGPRVRIVDEDADVVRLIAEQGGSCDDIGLTSTIDVELVSKLGTRLIEIEQSAYRSQLGPFECTVDDEPSDRCVEVRVYASS
jgi:hypothetical protein